MSRKHLWNGKFPTCRTRSRLACSNSTSLSSASLPVSWSQTPKETSHSRMGPMPAYTGVPWILVGERGHHSWAGVVEARTGRVRGLPLSASGYSPLARRCKVHAREACLATGFAAGSPPPKARLWDWARTGTAKRGNSLGPEYCGLARNFLRLPIAKSNSLYYLVHLGLTSRTSEQQQQPSLRSSP